VSICSLKILDRVRQTGESVIRMDNQVSPSCQLKNVSRGRGKSRTHSSAPGAALPTWLGASGDPAAPNLSFRLLLSAASRPAYFGLSNGFSWLYDGDVSDSDCSSSALYI
jgi:hypothetical protein